MSNSMNYSKIMEEIKSTRDFKKQEPNPDLIHELIKKAKEILKDNPTEAIFYAKGKDIAEKLSGKAGYFGKFIEAPSYICFTGKDEEKAAYFIEMVRFCAHEKGLGTCYITVSDKKQVKEALELTGDDPVAMLAIGEPYKGFFRQDVQARSARQATTEIVYLDKWGNQPEYDELEARGIANVFYLTRFAPSWGNKQPWKFLVAGDFVILTMNVESKEDMDINTGIASFYFERACVDTGFNIKKVDEIPFKMEELAIPKEYEIKHYYKF